jgi:hypothetical protein
VVGPGKIFDTPAPQQKQNSPTRVQSKAIKSPFDLPEH